jgi:putative endonuclease
MDRRYFVYILASRKHGTLYIGITNDLVRRSYEHKQKAVPGFTKQYGIDKLMYFEMFDDPTSAITREKQLRGWKRDWKIELTETHNPEWTDLALTLT